LRKDWTISAMIHASVLALALVTIGGAKPMDTATPNVVSVNIVPDADTSELTRGKKNAAKAEKPKPLVEKIAEPKPVENSATKVVEKPEIVAAFAPQPPPEPKTAEPKRVPPPLPAEAKPEPKPKETEKKPPDPQSDPIAEALKLDEAKKPEPKKVEAKKPEPKKPEPVKPAKPQPDFDPHRISALLDKRAPQRQAALGDTLNRTPALGTETGSASRLSQSEIDAFREKLKTCWNPPVGAPNAEKIWVPITIRLKPDRTLAATPQVEMSAHDAFTQATIDSAVRAIIQCQPYAMFSPQRYDAWKEIPLNFNAAEMFGG